MNYLLPKVSQKGFSTIEMLLAMAILILTLTTVILMSFGGQSMEIASQTNSEALSKAQALLEQEQALSRKDFKLVNATSTVQDIYTGNVTVLPVIDPATGKTDYFSKLVTATVSWTGEHGQHLSTSLSTRVSNFNNAIGGDTCDPVLSPTADAWKNPALTKLFWNFSTLTGITDNYPVTDVDAYKGNLYVTINNSSAATSTVPTFFVFDISNPNTISPISNDFVDNDLTVQSGLNAVAVADYIDATGNKKKYAYVASATSSKKFQVIDVTTTSPQVVPINYAQFSAGGGVGNSIFYKDGYVYLGLTKNGAGPQFYAIDVHNPTSPVAAGTFTVGNDVNAIYVRNGYAYLAVPNTTANKKLIMLDVNNPSSLTEVGSYSDAGGNNGKSIYSRGDDLYLGLTQSSSDSEFNILDASIPAKAPIPVLGSKPDINVSVDGLVVRSGMDTALPPVFHDLAFAVTPSQLQILDVTDPANINPWATKALDPSTIGSAIEPSVDCEGNEFFIGSNDAGKNGYLTLIAP